MAAIAIVATFTPKAGKVDRLLEIIKPVLEYIKDNEPGTLRYEVVRRTDKKSGVEEVVIIESYKDKEALAKHGSSNMFKKFGKTIQSEGLLGKEMELKILRPVVGFSRL